MSKPTDPDVLEKFAPLVSQFKAACLIDDSYAVRICWRAWAIDTRRMSGPRVTLKGEARERAVALAQEMFADGWSDHTTARMVGVSERTIKNWRWRYKGE